MNTELTAEKVMEMGKIWGESYLSLLSPEERLAGLDAEERLAGLKTRDIASKVDHQEFLDELSIEEIEAYFIKAQGFKKMTGSVCQSLKTTDSSSWSLRMGKVK